MSDFLTAIHAEIEATETRLATLRAIVTMWNGGTPTAAEKPAMVTPEAAAQQPEGAPKLAKRVLKCKTIADTAERMIRARGHRPVSSAEVLEAGLDCGLQIEAQRPLSYISSALSQNPRFVNRGGAWRLVANGMHA